MQRNIWELSAHNRHRIAALAGEFRMCAPSIPAEAPPSPYIARLRYALATILIDLARLLAGHDALQGIRTIPHHPARADGARP